MTLCIAEYLWLDGFNPTAQIRSKTKIIPTSANPSIEDFTEWGFDGSSTEQATGDDSDCVLQPVNFVKDSIRGGNNFLVLCEVLNPDGTAHKSNTRAKLRNILDNGAKSLDPWVGFEQEYTLLQGGRPLGWPETGYPAAQGPYYCGVGNKNVDGRELVEAHIYACLDAGIMIYGVNAEVMLGQWEFQVGYRGIEGEKSDVLTISDHMVIARWLLQRLGEDYGIDVSFDNKPVKGDWNGAGMHTNFSTNATRDKASGMNAINQAIELLSKKHNEHIVLYGASLDQRLTGLHETCDINTFRHGVADRGCSIRIPQSVSLSGYGYFEDRRPGANSDPFLVAARLCATVAGVNDSILTEDTNNIKLKVA